VHRPCQILLDLLTLSFTDAYRYQREIRFLKRLTG
jgi:hypothetical protein